MKNLILIFTLFISTTAISQFGGLANVSIGMTYNTHKSFNNFVNSYNDVIQTLPEYEKDLNPWRVATSFEIGVGVVASEILMNEIGFFSVNHKTSVDFSNGHKRKFQMRQREFNYMCTFGSISEGEVSFSAGLGINLIFGQLHSSFVYSGGYESYGEDARLNGVYKFVSLKPTLGFRLSVPIIYELSLTVKGDWVTPIRAGGNNENESGFYDIFYGKSVGSVSNYTELPQDYDPTVTRTPPNQKSVVGDWNEFRVRVGLTLFIFE